MHKNTILRLTLLFVVAILPLVAGCAAPAPVVQPQVVKETVVVEKPVEKIVQQTVVVEKPVQQTVVVQQTVAPAKKTVVTVAYNGYWQKTFGPADPPLDVLKREVAKKYPDIEVQFNLMPYEGGAWHDSYVTWFQAEDPTIDLLGVAPYWLPEFAQQGWLLPLNDVVDKKIVDQLMPAMVEDFSVDGKLLALGSWWGGIGGLYYRKDLLDKAGIQPPKTYDELIAAAKQIQKDNPGMAGWTWPALKDLVLVNRWQEFLAGHGGTFFDANGKCAMNNEKGQAALSFMKSLIDTGVTPKQALGWKEEESQVQFGNGEAVFHSGRNDLAFWLDDPKQSKVVGKWAFIPNVAAPGDKAGGFFEGWGFGINKFSKHQDAAAKVLEVMFDLPVQKDFNLSQGPLQGNKNVYTDADVVKNNPHMTEINAVAQTALAPIASPKFNEIQSILQEDLSAALVGTKDVKAALDDACKQIDALKTTK
jgi:multiple sugar transport system substrate-binding protein